jgi:hippurate hydrolase
MMAGAASFSIVIKGQGSHGARPEASVDPVLTAAHMTVALQSIVSRNITPTEAAVLSVTQIAGGDTFNVIPETARLGGTVRAFSSATIGQIEERMKRIVSSVAAAFGATASMEFNVLVPPLMNDSKETETIVRAATDLVGADNVSTSGPTIMASEDFSFMLADRPGAYMNVGIAGDGIGKALLHSPRYDFNDDAICYGAALLARAAERKLAV